MSRPTVSRIENGDLAGISVAALRRVAAPLQVSLQVQGWWRGGDGLRLLNRRHSLLAESFARFAGRFPGWVFEPEVSFSIFGERGILDQLGWNKACAHFLVVELKTELVDVNEMLGTLARKWRLARKIAAERGWRPEMVSVWLIVAESRTNRRHASEHETLLRTRFRSDGRSLASFLRRPVAATSGLAFWTDVHHPYPSHSSLAASKAVRRRKAPGHASGLATRPPE